MVKLKEEPIKHRRWWIAGAVILIILSSISYFITNNIYDSQVFANKVTESVTTTESIDAISAIISDELLKDEDVVIKVVADKPIRAIVSSFLETDLFAGIFNTFALRLNQFFTTNNLEPIVIDLSSISESIDQLINAVSPENTIDLSSRENQEIVLLDDVDLPPFQSIGQFFLVLGPLTAMALLTIFVVGWVKVKQKIQIVRDSGLTLIISGIILYIITYTSGALLTVSILDPNRSTLMEQIYTTFIADFRTYTFIMIVVGLFLYGIYFLNKKDIHFKIKNRK